MRSNAEENSFGHLDMVQCASCVQFATLLFLAIYLMASFDPHHSKWAPLADPEVKNFSKINKLQDCILLNV